MRITFQKLRYFLLTIGFSISYVSSLFTLTYFPDDKSLSLVVTALCANWIVFGILAILFIAKNLNLKLVRFPERDYFFYGVPMSFTSLVVAASPILERYFIAENISLYMLGLLSAAVKISLVVAIPISAFQTASFPLFMKYFKDADFHNVINFFSKFTLFLLSLISISICYYAEILLEIFAGPQYTNGQYILPFITILLLIQYMQSLLCIGLVLTKKTYIRMIFQTIALVVITVTVWNLSQTSNVYVVLIGMLIIRIVFLVIEAYQANMQFRIKWEYAGIGSFMFVVGILIFYSKMRQQPFEAGVFLFYFTLVATFLAVLGRQGRLYFAQLIENVVGTKIKK